MEFFPSYRHGPVIVTHEVPAHYRSHRLPAAEPLYARGLFGDYLVQAITGEGFRIQYNIFNIAVAGALFYPFVGEDCIALHFMLLGDICCLLRGFGQAWLLEGIYNLFYLPGGVLHQARFDPAVYFSFHLELPARFLPRLAETHPDLREAMEKLLHHSDEGVQQHSAHVTRKIMGLIDELKHCPYKSEPDKSWYLETRIRELLLLYVQDKPAASRFSPFVQRRMEKAAYIISCRLGERLMLQDVAAHVHVSVTTFKRWFTSYFGRPFQQYLLEKRMEYAKEQLRGTGKTLLQIAGESGYSDASAFSHAFKSYAGISPGDYRKGNF